MTDALLTKHPGIGESIQRDIKGCLGLIGIGSRGDPLPDGSFQYRYRCAISVNVSASTMAGAMTDAVVQQQRSAAKPRRLRQLERHCQHPM